jgi:hypothetical protein
MRQENKIYSEIDNLLVAISLSKMEQSVVGWKLPLMHFDQAEIFHQGMAPSVMKHLEKKDLGVFTDVHPRDLSNQWDVSMLNHITDAYENEHVFALSRFRSVPLKRARGIGTLLSGHVGEYSSAWFDMDHGTYRPQMALVQCLGRDADGFTVWDYVDKNPRLRREDPKEMTERLRVFLGIQFTRYYQWRVCLAYPGYPSLGLTTDPTGIRAIFRLRDVPDGRERRASLRNWVSEHWRTLPRTSEEDGTWVRQHLRGAMNFNWLGLNCQILPSQEAIDKNMDLAQLKKNKRSRKAA